LAGCQKIGQGSAKGGVFRSPQLMCRPFADCQQLMRSVAQQAIAMLAAIMKDKGAPEMTRLRAAKLILDLACGRPKAERVAIEVR
jgi:hypothetical protein